MKRKRNLILILLAVLILVCISVGVAAEADRSWLYALGLATRSGVQKGSGIAAVYGDREISMDVVEFERQLFQIAQQETGAEEPTDRELVNKVLQNIIMVEEAERLGVAATEEDIEAMYAVQVKNMENPKVIESLRDYLDGTGWTKEEYLERLKEVLPNYITRQKLRDHLGQAYCEEHGLTFTKVNPPREMTDAVDEYLRNLVAEHQAEIVYYVD